LSAGEFSQLKKIDVSSINNLTVINEIIYYKSKSTAAKAYAEEEEEEEK
jgi:hypothetical protein